MARASIKEGSAMVKANRWSFSSWCEMRKCAFAYYCRFIRGMQEPARVPHPAMLRGIELHKKSEFYLKGEVTSLPKALSKFARHYAQLKKMHPVVEKFWGVDKHWKPTGYGSWVVMKMDAAVEPSKKTDNRLIIIDLKTGQEKEEAHEAQGGLYAAIGSALYPKCSGIDVEMWYSDLGYPQQFEYSPAQLRSEVKFWKSEGERLLTVHPEKFYKPNPSVDNCKWCFLRTDKGGPCSAWKFNRGNG